MKYLIRDGKVEFSGSIKDLINYIRESYQDEYMVEEYGNIFNKDYDKFSFVVECLGMYLSDRKPR